MKQFNFLAEDERLEKLSRLGDPLEKLKIINWEEFRPALEAVFCKENKKAGGRPRYDVVLLFKILVLQRLYNISDDQTEYQINDRISFARFLGISMSEKVPDAKTIWLFRDTLTKAEVIEKLFQIFGEKLEKQGIITHSGTIVDATFVEAPRQRNHHEENKQIKEGKVPEAWQENTPQAKHKLAQKDTDARWTIKNKERHYGYKDHVKVDENSKMITKYSVTHAAVHDSREVIGLVDETDEVLFADSAYSGEEIASKLPPNVKNCIHEKAHRNRPLTQEQKDNNNKKSKIRARVEHVFGFMTGTMHGITVRTIGIARAKFNIGLTNLVYNLCRYVSVQKQRKTCMG